MRKWEVNLEQPCLMMYCTTAWVEAETQEQAEFKAIHDSEVRSNLDWSIHLDLAEATGDDYSYLATVGGQDAR